MKKLIFFLKYSICLMVIFICSHTYGSNNEKKLIEDIQSYFLNFKTLKADFIQIGPNGNISKGKIFIDLPGKIRLDYTKPNKLLITSQGFWLVIQDRKMKQTNNVPINETPLDFLLGKKINVRNENLEISVKKETGVILMTVKDLKKYNQSTLVMEFSEKPIMLKKWVIEDEFKNKTSVLLQNLNIGTKISHLMFFPDDFIQDNN